MTLSGTNSYLVDAGDRLAFAVDPGPPLEEHVTTLVRTAEGSGLRIAAILVSHGHPDHAPAAALLRARIGAPVYAHPDARFPFDVGCSDGGHIDVGKVSLRVEHAPGHARDHLVFWLEDDAALFTGDVVVGQGTVVIAPPGGDMRAYQATLERLRTNYAGARLILGGHGERIDDPRGKLDEYIAHRKTRERELLEVLDEIGKATIPQIVERLYADTPRVLWPAAARQVLAYLEALEREGRVTAQRLEREATPFEASLLHPDLSRIVDPATAAVARAELGLAVDAPFFAYMLCG
jgi:glyoxylase-like metal-dependent hydrolase (beta-lactamase superfamily II)